MINAVTVPASLATHQLDDFQLSAIDSLFRTQESKSEWGRYEQNDGANNGEEVQFERCRNIN